MVLRVGKVPDEPLGEDIAHRLIAASNPDPWKKSGPPRIGLVIGIALLSAQHWFSDIKRSYDMVSVVVFQRRVHAPRDLWNLDAGRDLLAQRFGFSDLDGVSGDSSRAHQVRFPAATRTAVSSIVLVVRLVHSGLRHHTFDGHRGVL